MKNKIIYYVLFFYVIVGALTIYFFNGTGDSGDSIMHYLFAKYAPRHPELFFNHWAKPLYVLLACPFAQIGFIGMKAFNLIATTFTIFFTYKIAQHLNFKNELIVAVLLIACPLGFTLTFSGLTEPLLELLVVISFYFLISDKTALAVSILSFTPFVRYEGYIFIGIAALYLILKKQWKYMPLLMLGHFVYAIAGFHVYHNLLWVFTENSSQNLSSKYGNGTWYHFFEQLMYVAGVPIYALFWLGFLVLIYKTIKKQIPVHYFVLFGLGFLSFFLAHTLFWYLGIFNSMGMKREFIVILPLMSISALMGFNFLTEEVFKNKHLIKFVLQSLLVVYVVAFPFSSNPAAINWKKDLTLSQDQETAIQVVNSLPSKNFRFVFSHPYLAEVLNVDYFDKKQHLNLDQSSLRELKPGDVVIWENWFAVVENGIMKKQLDDNKNLLNLYVTSVNVDGRETQFSVYQQK